MSSEKRKKRVKGESVHWDELKKTRTLTLTDTAWDELARKGEARGGISRSEVIEHWVRGLP
jgi:hypothetical protein